MSTVVKFFLSLIFCVMLATLACNSPTEPGVKNPREYVWTATQLVYPGGGSSRMYSIWGSNPSNVYACGFSILGGQKGAVWRYDGKKWTNVAMPSPDYNYLWEMTGFAENDIWIIGEKLYLNPIDQTSLDSSLVLHYDGTVWKSVLPSHMGIRGLKSLWGSSSQNLFLGSRDGKVLRYNGTSWQIDTLYLGLSLRDLGGSGLQVFAVGNTFKGIADDSVMSFKYEQSAWQLVDFQLLSQYGFSPRFGNLNIYSPSANIFYSAGTLGIFRWENNKWNKMAGVDATIIGMEGSSASNILAVGRRINGPVIFHWDGMSWDEIVWPEGLVPVDFEPYGVWTNGKEAFIVGNNGGTSYVLHGQ